MPLFRPAVSRPRHKAPRRRNEASNSFALFVVMLPCILGSFGMGLDMSRNVFIRTELQNALDMATVSGAGVWVVDSNGQPAIDKPGAIDAVEKVYAINRGNASKIDCWGTRAAIPGTALRKCWQMNGTPQVNAQYLSYGVKERSQNAFLTVVGVKWQKYDITSHAVINKASE